MSLELKIEKVFATWRELEELALREHEEMEKGWRPFQPDWRTMILLDEAGTFKVLTARKNGKLVGYFSWMIDFDMESCGSLIVHQCAWYVEPGHFGVAARMFAWARAEFKRLGVKFVYLHNAERGRGQTLGKFFEKQGAFHCSNTYVLPLGG